MVEEALSHVAVPAQAPAGRSTDYFGELVFGRNVMRRYLDRETYEALIQTMEHGTPLTREVADGIAAGMKQWAVEHGADHYTHWFQPLTGGTAEKHDSFAEPDGRGGRARRVLRQAARPAGTRCLVVPQRRNPQHVRSARLLRLGPRVARLHRRLDALHPDRVHRLHGRGARLQDPAAALAGSRRQGRDGSMPLLRPQRHEGFQLPGLGAGVLPRGRERCGPHAPTWC